MTLIVDNYNSVQIPFSLSLQTSAVGLTSNTDKSGQGRRRGKYLPVLCRCPLWTRLRCLTSTCSLECLRGVVDWHIVLTHQFLPAFIADLNEELPLLWFWLWIVGVCNRRSRHIKTVHKNCAEPCCDEGAYTEVSALECLQLCRATRISFWNL